MLQNKTPLEYAIALGVKIEGKSQAPFIVLSIAKGYKSDAINKVAPSGFKPIEWAIAMYSSSTKRGRIQGPNRCGIFCPLPLPRAAPREPFHDVQWGRGRS